MFDQLFARLMRREGVDADDPEDKGGKTRYGISSVYHPEMWANGPPSMADARRFYENLFNANRLGEINHPLLQEQVFDFIVNSGPGTAIQLLQMQVGVKPDGVLGDKTLKAINNSGYTTTNNKLVKARVRYLVQHHQDRFIRGWVDRALEFLIV